MPTFCEQVPQLTQLVRPSFLRHVVDMKILSFTLFLVLPILSLAQGVVITHPAKGATFTPGESFVVTVSEPARLSPIIAFCSSNLTNACVI